MVGSGDAVGTDDAGTDGASDRVPAIDVRRLTKRYGRARGIEDVNLTVRQGEIFGFIGPNGAGKSTTIRTLLGLIRKTGGEASILGLDCERDRTRILEQVGYLPSEVFYYDGMKARDLLKYAAGFYRVDCTERIRELSERLGLDLDKKVEDMSLGNRKKVGIVQGLMHRPRLIILDEPTSGLDPLVQRAFFDLIREENRRGATVLFSSHILSEVQRICDRVAIIREGRIVAVRSVAEMRRSAVKRVTVGLGDAGGPMSGTEAAGSDVDVARRTFASMSGVRSLQLDVTDARGGTGDGGSGRGNTAATASFLYEGDCNELIAALAGMRLTDVEIAEPTLEEVFMHYYQPESRVESVPESASLQVPEAGR
ncbi:ABC transporter ATP-binding protein [Bifidobacterium catulorum]|uniref:ABC transporter n=1 Tax=Bifidobacterium catulorum TaxID=1630173 RepID=A0A2U2MUV8_9BIFI|nr:ABC transporter ATP-binding protein [Bifidobacterium catulorum]PWG60639.1 ABC transporter [Bifidobacterium catulorum]